MRLSLSHEGLEPFRLIVLFRRRGMKSTFYRWSTNSYVRCLVGSLIRRWTTSRKLLWESKLRDSLCYISAGPARDVDLGTNSPSAPSASLTASLVGTAEMRGLVSVDVTATKVCDLQNNHYTRCYPFSVPQYPSSSQPPV